MVKLRNRINSTLKAQEVISRDTEKSSVTPSRSAAIERLPVECALMVLSGLAPVDLLRVSRVCKWFRSIILNKRMAKSIWLQAIEDHKLPNFIPDGVSIPEWIALCFEPWCTSCRINGASQVDFAFRARLCARCASRDVIHLNQYREVDGSIISDRKLTMLSQMVSMPSWTHADPLCGRINYPHLSSRASEGIPSGRVGQLAGPEHTVLKAQLDEVFHLLNEYDYEPTRYPESSHDQDVLWRQSFLDPFQFQLGYDIGFMAAYPEVAAVIKRNLDRVDEIRNHRYDIKIWEQGLRGRSAADEVHNVRKQEIIEKLEASGVSISDLPEAYFEHPIFRENNRLNVNKWKSTKAKLDDHLYTLHKGQQSLATWTDWAENRLPMFIASRDYIEDSALPVQQYDAVAFPSIMALIDAESVGAIPNDTDWATAFEALHAEVAEWRADIRSTLCKLIPPRFQTEGKVHPLDRATFVIGARSYTKAATKRKKSTNLPDKKWNDITLKPKRPTSYNFIELIPNLRERQSIDKEHPYISLDLDKFGFDSLRASAIHRVLEMAGIDAAETSLEDIEALGKRWSRQATTGEEFRYSFEELRCFRHLPFGLDDLRWTASDAATEA